jgi:molecular chaperone HtpG
MKMPSRIQKSLRRDEGLYGIVNSTIAEFSPFLQQSKMPFFPEYTDHGVEHLGRVLRMAEYLIRRENVSAWPIITPADSAALVLAVMLHDIGMHLTEDGFEELISEKCNGHLIEGLGDKPWHELWDLFLNEARRWDGKKLNGIFGNTEPVTRRLGDRFDVWTDRDKLLVGEFVRRHHPRLGHEVALFGFPGPCREKLGVRGLRESNEYLADVAGLVARSHGIPLRSSFSYLLLKYQKLTRQRDVHAVFLMTLLRIADYLQLHADRAPREMRLVRSEKSPISRREWDAHRAIAEIDVEGDHDPEAVYIGLDGKKVLSIETHLRLRDWLTGIQDELDQSWAVIGEVYGSRRDLRKLGLSLRRVKSNMDQNSYTRDLMFIPTRAAFTASDPDLLKRLIRPLYGPYPEVGIRELMQNAIDAVRESQAYTEHYGCGSAGRNAAGKESFTVQVCIEKDAVGECWITVADNGVGMTVATIRDYFLKAGASYRDSGDWRNEFENEQGFPRVLRSGRFGIGVLAAFLLGHKVSVSTRHRNAAPEEAISFTAGIEDGSITLQKTDRDQPGTTIRINISADTYKKLLVEHGVRWDWYRLGEPTVGRLLLPEARQLPSLQRLPVCGAELDPQWHRIHASQFDDVQWTFSKVPQLTCNGIVIGNPETGYNSRLRWGGHDFHVPLDVPKLSVFDSRALLPLNLQRYGLVEDGYPFSDELLRDVTKDFLAFTLLHAPDRHLLDSSPLSMNLGYYPGYSLEKYGLNPVRLIGPWLYTATGVSLPHLWHLAEACVEHLLFIITMDERVFPPAVDLSGFDGVLYANRTFLDRYGSAVAGMALGKLGNMKHANYAGFAPLDLQGARFLASTQQGVAICGALSSQTDCSDVTSTSVDHYLCLFSSGNCPLPSALLSLGPALLTLARQGLVLLAEWFVSRSQREIQTTPFTETWQQLFGTPIIPYDLQQRRTQFAQAFERLHDYVEKWRHLPAPGSREWAETFIPDPHNRRV